MITAEYRTLIGDYRFCWVDFVADCTCRLKPMIEPTFIFVSNLYVTRNTYIEQRVFPKVVAEAIFEA